MLTLNGNILTAVDVETTGSIDGLHEIVQVAAVPLDHNLDPLDVSPFYMNIRPEFPDRAEPEAMQVNGLKLEELAHCPDKWQVADCFDEWFQGLDLPMFKRLVYLTQNAPFDISFLKQWLGLAGYHKYFTFRGRDTMFTALAINDKAAWQNKATPFELVSLKHLCKKFGIRQDNHHDALDDCLCTAKVYKELMRYEI